jgi:carotenoid cleavage dioxygenase
MASAVEKMIRSGIEKGAMALADLNRSRMQPADNPFLTGLHAPLSGEMTLETLSVEGTLPAGLDGLYARNGPNQLGAVHPPSHHWFLGDAMVHGVRLQGGRALWYRNRWVRSNKVSEVLGETPAPGARNPRFDTANTNVLAIGDRLFAIVEAGGNPVELGPELETLAHNPFDGTLKGPFSAHPHRDPATGLSHAICYEGAPNGQAFHVVLDGAARVIRQEPIAVRDGPSIHDCAITDRHILIFDLPVTFSVERALRGFGFPYAWNPKHAARVGVLGLDAPGSSIRWVEVDPCYVFHPANAFEAADGTIVADVVVHASMFASSTMGPDSPDTRLERWTIPAGAGRVDRRVIDSEAQEFPRVDERLTGRRHRFAWTTAVDLANAAGGDSRLFLHDLEAGTRQVHEFGAGRVAGEFVHVPYGPGELDGWLIGLVIDGETSALEILDAADFAGPPVARVLVPHRIPPGFHGNWIPAPVLQAAAARAYGDAR